MPPVGLELTISSGKRPLGLAIYALIVIFSFCCVFERNLGVSFLNMAG